MGKRPPALAAWELLQRAESELRRLGYSAQDTAAAVNAFETFSRAVQWILRTTEKEDGMALENFSRKEQLLEFLLDLHARRRVYRSKVTSTLIRLLSFESWRRAVDADASVSAAVHELLEDPEEGMQAKFVHRGVAVNMKTAAIAAEEAGHVGALYVRVVAASGLGKRAGARYYVRMTIDQHKAGPGAAVDFRQLKRTAVAGDAPAGGPRWDSAPFLLEVPELTSTVTFEVIDSSDDEPVASVTLPVADATWRPGKGLERKQLLAPGGTQAAGELEVELVFRKGRRGAAMMRAKSLKSAAVEAKPQDQCHDDEAELLSALLQAMEEAAEVDEEEDAAGVDRCAKALEAVVKRAKDAMSARKGSPSTHLQTVVADAEAMVDTFREQEQGATWLVSEPDAASKPAQPPGTEQGVAMVCPCGHVFRKQTLGWYQKGMRLYRCDICEEEIPKDVDRWRCDFPCMYDVCLSCYEQQQKRGTTKIPAWMLSGGQAK